MFGRFQMMDPSAHVRVKVCCIATTDEARSAVSLGASALGLVSAMPSGPGPIAEALIADIAATVPPGVATFLLTCRQDAPGIVTQQRRCRTNVVQLCDAITLDVHAELRAALPGIGLVQVIHVNGEASVAEAVAAAPHVDAILLDSGQPNAATKTLGGTGRRHDWTVSRHIRQAVAVPVWLAGGLTPDNVAEAIATVGPFGVDLCNGVRTAGRLDAAKLAAFMRATSRAQ